MKRIRNVAMITVVAAVTGSGQDTGRQPRAVLDLPNAERAYQLVVSSLGDATVSDAFAGPVVKNRPVSATETRRTVQILANGTHIESRESSRLFRDVDGRTRVEGKSTSTIADPVSGFRITLDPATKLARQIGYAVGGGRGGALAAVRLNGQARPEEVVESLPQQNVNGVLAQGTRTTITIPKGQIGNDRDIKVVTERWYSSDLQMLIKSTNTDPRFGETTYALTNVALIPPDPALFQIPADYQLAAAGRGFNGMVFFTTDPAGSAPPPGGRGRGAAKSK